MMSLMWKNNRTLFFWTALPIVALIGSAALSVHASPPAGHGYDFPGNGKRVGMLQEEPWRAEPSFPIDRAGLPAAPALATLLRASPAALTAASLNMQVASRTARAGEVRPGNLVVSGRGFRATAAAVRDWLSGDLPQLPASWRFYRWCGEDHLGNVHFTGYYSPSLPARTHPDARFRYPIYRFPSDLAKPGPTRRAIERDGVLSGRNLELAWTDDLLSLFFLHVQGSGWLEFPHGRRQAIEYAGQNGHPYNSLGRRLVGQGAIPAARISLRSIRDWFTRHPDQLVESLWQNPSYVFFRPHNRPVAGAAGIKLTAGHSVAADRRFLPLGSCLLAEMPVLDEHGNLTGYEWRLLFVHDTGGAIREGHLDVYHGVGAEAGDRAGDLHHYGNVWLILDGAADLEPGPRPSPRR